MYQPEQIRELFGDEVLEYLTNKNRGGSSAEKGNTYENFFAVYQLALQSREVIETGRSIQFLSQSLAFVDDLIIDAQGDSPLYHYQLKNSSTVLWGSGLKSISDDFRLQHMLNQSVSRSSELYLVVSDETIKSNLTANIPPEIEEYSQVLHFSYAPNLVQVVLAHPDFRSAIEYLCAFEHPERDKIECVVIVLLGAWTSSGKSGISAMDILTKAQESTPSFIRSFSREWSLDPEVETILASIEGFSYNLAKGFLHWKYLDGLDQGTLPYSIDTEAFGKFQTLIKRDVPTSFEALEGFLI